MFFKSKKISLKIETFEKSKTFIFQFFLLEKTFKKIIADFIMKTPDIFIHVYSIVRVLKFHIVVCKIFSLALTSQ